MWLTQLSTTCPELVEGLDNISYCVSFNYRRVSHQREGWGIIDMTVAF